MGIHRSAAARKRRREAEQTRAHNARLKTKERRRRAARMMERIKSGTLPYTPEIMSWLSLELDKKSSRISAEDIATL